MSADSSGLGKPDGGSSPGEMSSSTSEAGEVTEGKVDNACNSQAHSTPHCTQSQTNHTPIPIHTQNADGTNQDGASCHGDKGAKVGEQNDGLTSMTVKVSNSEQKCMGKSSYKKVVGTQCASNEDSESSVEDEDQSDEVESLGGKGGKQDKTFGNTRSENDAGDPSNEAVQEAEKVNLDENPRGKSDSNRIPKGNEQKDNCNGAIPGVKDEKHNQKSGRNDTEERKSVYENAIDNMAVQEAENENHDQNSELKHTEKRPSGNEYDIDEGAMQRAEDEKHDQNNGNKDIDKRSSGKDIDDGAMQGIEVERTRGNEKDTDNRTRPSVKNENNGDNDIEKRLIKYEKNDKGNMKTKVVKEESPDIKKKANDTERESRENEKKDHPDNATQSASIKMRQRIEKSLEDNGSEQSQNEMSGNTNNDGEWSEGKKERDKRRPTCLSGDPDMNPSNVNTHGTDSTISEQDDNGAMPGAVMLPIDNSKDKSAMKNEGLGQIAVTATDRESQTEFGKLKNELGETDKGTIENKGNYQDDGTNLISQAGNSELSDNTASVLGYPSKNFDDSDGGTKEIKGKGALGKTTPNTQTDSQDENHAYHQDEAGAISSEPSREALSFSQRLDDDTLLEKQLDEFIDNISTGINENREEWKKSTKKKMKSFLRTKVMDGTLSQRSFDSCVTNNIPVENFDSDIHITEKPKEDGKGAMREQGAEGGPLSSQYDVRGIKMEQGVKGGPSSSQHSQANDPSKCTTAPDAEIPFIDSEENGQGPPEQSTSQTEVTKSLRGKTSRAPNPTAGDPRFSKTCSSTESSRQAGKRDTTAMHLNRSLNTASSNKFSSEKGMKNEKESTRRLPTLPVSGSGAALMSKTYIKGPSTSSMIDSEINQGHERDNFNPTLSTTHDNRSEVVEDKRGGSPISPGSLKASGYESFADNLVIALGGKEMKFGPLMIGSSQKLRCLEIHCSKEDFYKLFLIFDSESFRNKAAQLRFTGKLPAVTIVINPSFRDVDDGVRYVENFLKNILQTVTSSCQRFKQKVVDLYIEEVLKCFNGDVQVYYDEDDNTCLWFVCEENNSHLISKAIDLFAHGDYFEKVSNDPPSHDHDETFITCHLIPLELELCKKFNISETLRAYHGKTIKDISIDEDKCEFKISVISGDDSAVKRDIKRFLDVKKDTKMAIKKIPKCCINFLKMPIVKKEIGTEVPYCVHVQNDECNPDVYSDTQEHAKKLVCIIEGLFLQEKVDLKDFDTGSDILKTKVGKWRKEFSDMVGIDLTAEHIEIWGLRRCVEKIISQLENECQQNTKASSLELSGKDKFLTTCYEGEIPFSKEEDVKCLESRAFQNKIVEIQDRHNCLIKLDMENAYPLENKIPNGWSWYFQNGQRVSFENSEVIAMQPNQTSCVVKFLSQQTKPGINFLEGNTTYSKNASQATIALPVWRDGQNKEKEFLRKCSQLLFLRLRDQNISTVVIELVMDSALQWPEKQVLKSILYWRRHFMDLTVFCHPDEDKYNKLLPIFHELKDEPEKEEICIRIEKKKFTEVKVQVLVNTVGWDLNLKKGHVSNSILLAAGNKIQMEANEKFPNGLLGGEVLVTDAYKLCDRGILKVFHGSLLQWKDFESIAAIKSFVAKCLCLATEYGLTSIAFPALGTGNLGYEHSTVAAAMFETVRSFMEGSVYTSVKEVVFNVFDEKSIEAFFQEEKKYLNKPCKSGTFLPRTYRFSGNNLTFELYFGEVWAQDVKGLVVLYESSEIFKKDDKKCIAECGKSARNFGGENTKQQLQSGKLDVVKIKVWRPVEWIFCLTWKYGRELETASLALKSVEEEKLDSVAFAISKKDGVAGQLAKIIGSVFAATKEIRKGSPLRKVIIVVDQPLRSAACKIVEDHCYEIHNIEKKRYRMSFTCNSQNSLQNAKAEVILALDSLKEATLNQNNEGDDFDDETIDEETQYNQKGKNVPSKESVKNEAAKKKESESELKSLELRSAENCSLILKIINEKFLEQELDVIKQRLHKDVLGFFVPVKIIFPFLNKREALLKFDTYGELGEFKRIFQLDYIKVKDDPVQAVTCVNATVSKTAKERFLQQGWTADDITERSGVAIKNLNDSLVLEGSLLEIQAAREFIKDACHQCKAFAKEKKVPKVSQNSSLDYDNSLFIQQTNSKFKNELSHDDKDKTEFKNGSSIENTSGTKKTKDESGKLEGALQKSLATEFVDKKSQFMTDLSANVASHPTEAGREEPANQSIRQKERVYIPYLDFEILENLFPESSDIAKNVNILKKDVVEIVGNHDAVQPYREAITKIEGYQKIAIDLKETDRKNFRIHQNKIQMVFPNVLVLLHKEKMHIVSHENNPDLKENVISIISQQLNKESRNGNHRGRGKADPGSNYKVEQREQISTPIQKTTLGKQVFQRKEFRVFVQPGDIFSLEDFDCLVNPTNEYLDLERKGGLSAAVHDRAGEKVQHECTNIIRNKKRIEIGKCVGTSAGNLKYKRIVHTIVRPWKEFKQSKFQYETAMLHIQEIVKGCLALATNERMTSIVFPAIGSGQSAIPPIVLANGYRLGCESFSGQTTLRDIYFVIGNSYFLSLVERTFLAPLPWCLYWQNDEEYTFHMSELCKIVVAKRDVLKENGVDSLVVLEDPFMSAKGKLATQVLNAADGGYKKKRESLKNRKHRLLGSAAALPYSGKLKYKTIVQITMEDCAIQKWKDSDVKHYKNCILEALKLSKNSIAMQLFVGKNTAREVMLYYAKALAEAVAEHIANDKNSYLRILILNTDPVRHQLVKEEFNRLIRQACNANAYFEKVVFLNCENNHETRL